MATTRSFDTMLNEYLTMDLMREEYIKRDYFLNKVEKDNGWKGGTVPVPFKAAGASSVAFGSLTADDDVSEDKYIRGEVSTMKEVWGTLAFHGRDLIEHDGGIKEKTFLKILPDAIESFMEFMKMSVSINMLNGSHFATLTADATASNGIITVDHPDRLQIGQKLLVKDTDAASKTGYVKEINMNTNEVLLVTARGGSTAVDFSDAGDNMTTAKKAKVYQDGALTNSFTCLKDALLPYSAGGSQTLYGVSKLAYPYLQATAVDGSTISASNILTKIFDAYVEFRKKGRGSNPNEILMSYKHFGSILKALETAKGAFNVEPGSMKTSVYGWTEIVIGGIKGSLKCVAIHELDDDFMAFVDWRSMKFLTNGFFRKRTAPDGKSWYEKRSTSGYLYLVDTALYGELVVHKPWMNGIIYGISYA